MTGRRGILLVLSGPSGAGKTTAARALLRRHRWGLQRSVSVTTRPRRPGEKGGKDYHFVTAEQFAAMAARGEFLEEAEVHGHRYGTPRLPVEQCLRRGVDMLLVLDVCGRERLAASHPAELVSVFLLPPSRAELERRLRNRGQDAEKTVARRLAAAPDEIAQAAGYDYILVNDDLDNTLEALDTILRQERAPPAKAGIARAGRRAPAGY